MCVFGEHEENTRWSLFYILAKRQSCMAAWSLWLHLHFDFQWIHYQTVFLYKGDVSAIRKWLLQTVIKNKWKIFAAKDVCIDVAIMPVFFAEQNVIFTKNDIQLVVVSDSHSPLTSPGLSYFCLPVVCGQSALCSLCKPQTWLWCAENPSGSAVKHSDLQSVRHQQPRSRCSKSLKFPFFPVWC